MKKIKRATGYLIVVMVFPLIFGLLSIDGELCAYGICEDFIPFWGGFLLLLFFEVCAFAVGLIFIFAIRLMESN